MNEANYGYGFNGKEIDNEVKGNSNSIDFGARMYDTRVGRWVKTDPLAHLQPDQSPYKSFLNNPILYVDPAGRTEYITIKQIHLRWGQISLVTYRHVEADRYIAGGEMRNYGPYSSGYNPFKREFNYYDFKTEITETYAVDGRLLISSKPKYSILKDNGVTLQKTHLFFSLDKGDITGPEYAEGGVYIYGDGGSGYENGAFSSKETAKSSIDMNGGLSL